MGKREERILEGKIFLTLGNFIHSRDFWVFTWHEWKIMSVSAEGGLLQYGIRLLELWDFSHPAGNIPEMTSPSLFPLAALILLCHCNPTFSAIYCCNPILFARSTSALKANLSGKSEVQSSEKKRFWWGRRESRLVCHSHSYECVCKCFHNHQSWKLKMRSKRRIRKGERKQLFHWLQDL